MPESIQNCCPTMIDAAARWAWISAVAEHYGRLPAVDAEQLLDVDDTAAVLMSFPWMSDPELLEALWALDRSRHG